jgi:hypothetical protein
MFKKSKLFSESFKTVSYLSKIVVTILMAIIDLALKHV